MLVRSVTFGPKSVEKHPQQGNFFELTTPTGRLEMRLTLHHITVVVVALVVSLLGHTKIWSSPIFSFFLPLSNTHFVRNFKPKQTPHQHSVCENTYIVILNFSAILDKNFFNLWSVGKTNCHHKRMNASLSNITTFHIKIEGFWLE